MYAGRPTRQNRATEQKDFALSPIFTKKKENIDSCLNLCYFELKRITQILKRGYKNMSTPIKIDKDIFENLCEIQCTKEEIAKVFNCSTRTILRFCKDTYGETFETVYSQFLESGKASIRRMQFASAKNGSITMQIWLGKQYLGQTDKPDKEDKSINDPLLSGL